MQTRIVRTPSRLILRSDMMIIISIRYFKPLGRNQGKEYRQNLFLVPVLEQLVYVQNRLQDDVKNIRRALDSEESFNLLLWGEPASSKTLFLLELAKQKGSLFSIVPIRQAGF